jgi:ribosomal protein S18 acetylase RimI-like enzyme
VDKRAQPEVAIVPVALDRPEHGLWLLDLLDHYARDPMGGGKPLSNATRAHLVEALRARADYAGLFALSAGEPVGLLNAFEGFSTFAARPLLNIHDLVVRQALRGQGIAQRLLLAAEELAHARGCVKLTLEVLSNNQRAQESYARFGFRAYALDPAAGHALFLEKPLG